MANLGRAAAGAKLNLILRVEGRRTDGFHQLRMLNVPLDFADEVSISRSSGPDDSLEISISDEIASRYSAEERRALADPRRNSCLAAVRLFRKHAPLEHPVRMVLKKNLPAASGLGGGSSDAAAVLRILGKEMDSGVLSKIAAMVGADVPFFLSPCAAEVTGVGEQVRRIDRHPLRGREVLLVIPSFGCSTPEVYSAFKKLRPVLAEVSQPDSVFPAPELWKCGDALAPGFVELLKNDLFEAAAAVRPELAEIFSALAAVPDSFAALTGSGSALFLLPRSCPAFTASQRVSAFDAGAKFGCLIRGCKIL